MDVSMRLDELRLLKNGGLTNKHGIILTDIDLDWLVKMFDIHYSHSLPVPYCYLNNEGYIQFEWSLNGYEIVLIMTLATHLAEWYNHNINDDLEDHRLLDLNDPLEWQWISQTLQQFCQ